MCFCWPCPPEICGANSCGVDWILASANVEETEIFGSRSSLCFFNSSSVERYKSSFSELVRGAIGSSLIIFPSFLPYSPFSPPAGWTGILDSIFGGRGAGGNVECGSSFLTSIFDISYSIFLPGGGGTGGGGTTFGTSATGDETTP